MSRARTVARIALGELAATGLFVLVAFLSGLARVEFGTTGFAGAVTGSVALGLGTGLLLATFGPWSKAQTNPVISVIASIASGQAWSETAVRAVAQVVAAAATTGAARAIPLVGATGVGLRPLADGVAAFAFLLVAIGVAPRRDLRVPLALGAFATASFWMTARATLGNPLLALALAASTHPSSGAVAAEVGCTAGGSVLAAAVGWIVFPSMRESLGLLMYAPRKD